MSDYRRGIEVLTRRAPPRPARLPRIAIGQDHAMPSLPTKGFFERGPEFYRDYEGGSIGFARAIGCDSIILLERVFSVEKLQRAHAAGLKCWVWAGPDSWRPSEWRETRGRLKTLCQTHPLLLGYVPDAETFRHNPDAPPEWVDAPRSEVEAMADAFNEDSTTLSIIFTSFPSWGFKQIIAQRARHVSGAPQLYGNHSRAHGDMTAPLTPPAQLLTMGRTWASLFGGGYCPVLAMWHRTAPEQRTYLDGMRSLRNVLFWHETLPTNDTLAAVRDFVPGSSRGGGGIIGGIATALGLGVVGGLIVEVIKGAR